MINSSIDNIADLLLNFTGKFHSSPDSSESINQKTELDFFLYKEKKYPKYTNEFWTSKQRQGSSIHEISYRACFKAQLPKFFIELFTNHEDVVYDPFSGRGTTVIEAGLLGRNIIANDINPLSKILSYPRFFVPSTTEILKRLESIKLDQELKAKIDLSMFYHPQTESELVSLRDYLENKKRSGDIDHLDEWINMIATNRLTGHSKGFFSVYTLPPNQAVSQERQVKINQKRNQIPEYRNIMKLILKKSKSLVRNLNKQDITNLRKSGSKALFLIEDARKTERISSNSVNLIVTSPPFLNVVQYSKDNWLRCWFNNINSNEIDKNITMSSNLDEWIQVMNEVFAELYRILKPGGWIAFEVGEVRGGKIKLDENIVPIGVENNLICEGIVINRQVFTKTSNIWGINNNQKGTNTNRIVLFKK